MNGSSCYVTALISRPGPFLCRYPKDPELRSQWLRAIGKETWTPLNSSVVCGKHFDPECFRSTTVRRTLKTGSIPTLYIPEAQSAEPLINSLNADCWRLIFDHLSVRELVRAERTCRQWQDLVLDHLSHRRIDFSIQRDEAKSWPSIKRWLRKCGGSVRTFSADCKYLEDVVEVLRATCPNLEDLTLKFLSNKLSPTSSTQHFPKLARLEFIQCTGITDDCVSQLLTSDTKELSIRSGGPHVTGSFLRNLKNDKMKRLKLIFFNNQVGLLIIRFLLFCADRLKNLTALVLWDWRDIEINTDELHCLLDELPNLEVISFNFYGFNSSLGQDWYRRQKSRVFFESVCGLKKLQRFEASLDVWDEHLEALAINCKDLVSLRCPCNRITKVGVAALCRQLGPQLCELNLSGSHLDNDTIVDCVYACPNLQWLQIPHRYEPEAGELLARIDRARADVNNNQAVAPKTKLMVVESLMP